jgi:hypothetical protein
MRTKDAFLILLPYLSAKPIFLPSSKPGLKEVKRFRTIGNISEIFLKNSPFSKILRIIFLGDWQKYGQAEKSGDCRLAAPTCPAKAVSATAEAEAAKAGQSESKRVKPTFLSY